MVFDSKTIQWVRDILSSVKWIAREEIFM
jgi:hypothetical protein